MGSPRVGSIPAPPPLADFLVFSVCLVSPVFGEPWLGLAWLGLAWLGLAWLGLAWLGLAWLGFSLVFLSLLQKNTFLHSWVGGVIALFYFLQKKI